MKSLVKRPTRTSKSKGSSSELLLASLVDVQANILIADLSMTIVFASPVALATLKLIETDLKRIFNIQVDKIVGSSIHTFHKDPKRVERMLNSSEEMPHTTEFAFGHITFQIRGA